MAGILGSISSGNGIENMASCHFEVLQFQPEILSKFCSLRSRHFGYYAVVFFLCHVVGFW